MAKEIQAADLIRLRLQAGRLLSQVLNKILNPDSESEVKMFDSTLGVLDVLGKLGSLYQGLMKLDETPAGLQASASDTYVLAACNESQESDDNALGKEDTTDNDDA